MYVGHFALGVALKARHPTVRALPIMLGVGFIDILDGLLVVAGLDRVRANLAAGPYLFFDLVFIDWDHSLTMAFLWSAVWAALFARCGARTAAVAFTAALSHIIADWPMHNHDLALYPYAQAHTGFGLWGKLGTGAWIAEGLFAIAVVAYAAHVCRTRQMSLQWPAVLLTIMFFNLSPWLSPMKFLAQLDEPAAHILHGLLVTTGFVVPGLLLTWLLNRAEDASTPRT